MTERNWQMDRRFFLQLAAGSSIPALHGPQARTQSGFLINDVSQLNPVQVSEEQRPRSTDEVKSRVAASKLPVSVGGGRFSMGGQVWAPDSLHLDMRSMNQVIWFDPTRRRIRVQAGTRWRDIQQTIDPANLSVQIMQSYSNFTVGGSVSVNWYYLPYRLDATQAQFDRAYPEARSFALLKQRVDPRRTFTNLLWSKYLS